jgi:hypothetical protein
VLCGEKADHVRPAPDHHWRDEAGAEDLLVIGAGRRGRWARLVSGRVARYCLRHAECPVLAMPPAALSSAAGLRGGAFRQRELDRALRDWGKAAA